MVFAPGVRRTFASQRLSNTGSGWKGIIRADMLSGILRREALLESIFEGKPHPLKTACADWIASSRRFTQFCEGYQAKIRKKIRSAADVGGDLYLELETAYLLLCEDALSVEYEPDHRRAGRSADFAVSFTTRMRMRLEVTHMRASVPEAATRLPNRLADTICDKLGQLDASGANVVLIGIDSDGMNHIAPQNALKTLRQRAERNDADVVERHGFKSRSGFFDHYRRLSAVMLRGVPLRQGADPVWCDNPLAKHPLPARVKTALIRSHTLI